MAVQARNSTILSMSGLVVSLVSIVQLGWVLFLSIIECRLDPKDVPANVRWAIVGGQGLFTLHISG